MCKYPSREYFVREYVEKKRSREDLAKENGVSVATIKTHLYKKRIFREPTFHYGELYELYVTQRMTMKQIASITGHDRNAVARALKKYNFEIENHYVQYDDALDDEWISLYLQDGKSTFEIANLYGVSHGTVKRHLVRNGIELRGISDALRTSRGKGPLHADLFNRDVMYELYVNQKRTLNELGDMYDCTARTVRDCLVSLNIPIRTQTEVKIGLMTGKDHPNWKGGLTTLNARLREFFNCNVAPQCRARDLYRCRLCGSQKNLHCHHVIPFSWIVNEILKQHPDLNATDDADQLYDIITHDRDFLNVGNLVTYCRDCHLFRIHGYKRTISSQASQSDEGSTTIPKGSTSQAIGDGNGEDLP